MVQSSQGFQTQVAVQPAPAVEGDFASTNPRFSALAGPGAFIAGSAGVTVARFAWAQSVFPGGGLGSGSIDGQDSNAAPAIVTTSNGAGPVYGFIHREQQGLNTTYLSEAGMTIPAGFMITIMSGGDFWVKNNGTNVAVVGMKAYASFLDGKASFAATGNPSTGSFTGSIGSQTSTFAAAISGNVLNVSSVATGSVQIGGLLSGGTGIIPGTSITSQISGGTIGGVGLYTVSPGDQTVASAALTESWGLLNVNSGVTGTLGLGVTLTGTTTALTANTLITQFISGTGGTGTYVVNNSQSVGSEVITFGLSIETKWIAMSTAQPGELLKMSDHALG